MNRRAIAMTAVLGLLLLAGCSAFGPGDVNRERLDTNATYTWDTRANVTFTLEQSQYKAVYRIENQSTFEIYRFHRLNNRRPVDPAAVKFRYPNGRIVGAAEMEFEKTQSGTEITLPNEDGQLAMSLPKNGKRIRAPAVLEGDYEVILPENARVGIPLLGRVVPRGYERTTVDGQVHLYWESVQGDRVVVRYYLVRDLYLFGGLLALSTVILIGGVAFFWIQLKDLRERREEVALEGDGSS